MNFGLTDSEVTKNREKYGVNELSNKHSNSFLRLIIESLGDPIIKILLIALAIKIVFLFKNFDWYETIGILIAIFLASFISSISEYGSNKAFERLQQESQMLYTKVIRNGKLQEIIIKDVVVGDLIKISSGDRIPADGVIVEGTLSLDESFMSGEAREIYKKTNDLVYGSSVNYKGDALVRITAVGNSSYIGNISSELQTRNEDSPLKKRLRTLATQISKLGYIGALLASLTYLFMKIIVVNDYNFVLIWKTITNIPLMSSYLIYCLTLSVTIIIMAVPEGLPMMITLVLSSNMKRMLQDKVLVRKLVGIETSGSLNVLLCDKTGTLTEGKLKLIKIKTYNGMYNSYEQLVSNSKVKDIIAESLYLNNETIINNNELIGGNTTDRAIMQFIKKYNSKAIVKNRKEFSSEYKYSSVSVGDNTYYKGASEVLLPKCTAFLDEDGHIDKNFDKEKIHYLIQSYTNRGYRVLLNALESGASDSLIFISLLIISDTIRSEAPSNIKAITKAGIKVVMITGDAKNTAVNIAEKLLIYKPGDCVYTHEELDKMSDEDILKNIDRISIIARALPKDKSRLVSIYKQKGLVVGMTGDGVNDALALKKSDVSFALGSGSEVAKEASDIVIMDDNISSIYKAILYGRTIFKSIRKFVVYQLTVNISALVLSIVGVLIGVATPITIVQMLWLNMIMDTFAGLAFSYEPPLKEYMEEKSKTRDEPIMNRYMLNQIIVNGLASAIVCLLFLKLPFIRSIYRNDTNDKFILTAFYALFIFIGIINSFLSRTTRINLFANLFKNKIFIIINSLIIITQIFIIYYGGIIFRTFGLTSRELIYTVLISFLMFPIDLIRKIVLKKKNVPLIV